MDENRVKDPLGQYEEGQRAALGGSKPSDGFVVAGYVLALIALAALSVGLLVYGLFF